MKQPYPLHNLPTPIAGRKPLTIPPLSEQPPPLDPYSMSHNKWYVHVILGIPLSHDIPYIQCHALRPPTHLQPGLLDPDVDMPTISLQLPQSSRPRASTSPKMSVPVTPLFQQLPDFLARPGIEKMVKD